MSNPKNNLRQPHYRSPSPGMGHADVPGNGGSTAYDDFSGGHEGGMYTPPRDREPYGAPWHPEDPYGENDGQPRRMPKSISGKY